MIGSAFSFIPKMRLRRREDERQQILEMLRSGPKTLRDIADNVTNGDTSRAYSRLLELFEADKIVGHGPVTNLEDEQWKLP